MATDPKNYAFIDGQNLYLGTTKGNPSWQVDFGKLRIYLKEKYNITKAYYFLGYVKDENNGLYTNLQEAGFIVVFKKQMIDMKTSKKGNIDSDLIFNVMERMVEEPNEFDKVLLISGDGDFRILVDYLVKKGKFLKMLFPNKDYASSLYNVLGSEYFDYMINIRTYIEYLPNGSAKGALKTN